MFCFHAGANAEQLPALPLDSAVCAGQGSVTAWELLGPSPWTYAALGFAIFSPSCSLSGLHLNNWGWLCCRAWWSARSCCGLWAPTFTFCVRTVNKQLPCKGTDPTEHPLLRPLWAARVGVLPMLSPARVPCLPFGGFDKGWRRRMSPLHGSSGLCRGAVAAGSCCR